MDVPWSTLLAVSWLLVASPMSWAFVRNYGLLGSKRMRWLKLRAPIDIDGARPMNGLSLRKRGKKDDPTRARIEVVQDTYLGTTIDDPYRWMDSCRNAKQLWREITAQGYGQSRSTVDWFIAVLRQETSQPYKFKRVSAASLYSAITVQGQVTEFPISTAIHLPHGTNGITAGPDGALWFSEFNADKIGCITVQGTLLSLCTARNLIRLPLGRMERSGSRSMEAARSDVSWSGASLRKPTGYLTQVRRSTKLRNLREQTRPCSHTPDHRTRCPEAEMGLAGHYLYSRQLRSVLGQKRERNICI